MDFEIYHLPVLYLPKKLKKILQIIYCVKVYYTIAYII